MEQNGGLSNKRRSSTNGGGVNGENVGDSQDFSQLMVAKLSCCLRRPLGPYEYFQIFLKALTLSVTPAQFRKYLLEAFEEEKSRVKSILSSLDTQICLSVDCLPYWEDGSGDNYMCLAAHFIDDEWRLNKWVLKFCRVSDDSLDCLDQAILKSLKEWEIEGKIFSLTGHYFGDEFVQSSIQEKKKLQLDGQLFGVNCCAQMFNLMAEDVYKEVPEVIGKVQELISWKSPPVWYMPAHKLKEALALESMGEFSSQDTRDNYNVPTVDEWAKARCVSKLVISAHKAAKSLFETKYPSANIFLHKLQQLRSALYRESISADDFNSKMAKKMLGRLDEYWNEAGFILAIACVLDPRCKMRYIEFVSSKGEISGNKLQPAVVLDAIRSLYGDYVIRDGEREHPVTDSEDEDEGKSQRNVVGDSVLLQEYNQLAESINQPPKSDLDRYLEDPIIIPCSKDFNALNWWRVQGPKYPVLSKMARDMLAIPMSVATSYDAYDAFREADPDIIKSGPDSVRNVLMCTRSWNKKR